MLRNNNATEAITIFFFGVYNNNRQHILIIEKHTCIKPCYIPMEWKIFI